MRIISLLLSTLVCIASLSADPITIKIGASLPFSGALGFAGQDIRRGLDLAVEDFGSEKIKYIFIYDDNEYVLSKAASSAQKLISQDKVDLMISLWDTADVISPIAEAKKIPNFAIRWNPHIAEKFTHTITVESTYQSNMDELFRMLKTLNYHNIAMITQEAEGWVLGAEYLRKNATRAGMNIVADEVFAGMTPDYGSLLTRIAAKKPDVLVINSNPPHTDLIVQRAKLLIPGLPLTGYFDLIQDPSLVEGLPYIAQFDAAPWFSDRFRKAYGEDFQVRAPQAYDILKLITQVTLAKGRKLNADELIAELKKLQGIPGASGILTVNSKKNIESNCVWKMFTQGKARVVTAEEIRPK
jgi:ABC-type branched-subunit amino acid transport system substrate-binding protein